MIRGLVAAIGASAIVAGGALAANLTQDSVAAEETRVVWAVGDMCDNDNAARDCADVGEMIASDPERSQLLLLGDQQYDSGTLSEYRNWFHPKMGHLNSIARPVPGNHEYASGTANGYFDYFGTRAGDRSRGYYSFTTNGWRVIALNTTCGKVPGGCGYTSAQSTWLANQLAQPEQCELVFGHHPYITDGDYYPGIAGMKNFFRRAIEGRAEMFLSGHDHNYQRFAPRDLNRNPSASGVAQIVVGNGGSSLYPFVANRTVARNNSDFGALRLVLSPTSYTGAMHNLGGNVVDNFSGTCR